MRIITFLLLVCIFTTSAVTAPKYSGGVPADKLTDSIIIDNALCRVEKHYDEPSKTWYLLTRISHTDKKGKLVKLRLSFTDKNKPMGETASEFSRRVKAALVFNASMSSVVKDASGANKRVPSGVQIINGKIIQERSTRNRYILAIKDNNELVVYPPNTSGQEIVDDGIHTALSAFIPLIIDHKPVSDDILNLVGNSSQTHPRQVIAQFDDLDIVFLTCGGRGHGGIGMTAKDLTRILMKLGVKFAYNLDGGGSISTVVDGNFINWKIDGHGTKERLRANFLYVK